MLLCVCSTCTVQHVLPTFTGDYPEVRGVAKRISSALKRSDEAGYTLQSEGEGQKNDNVS